MKQYNVYALGSGRYLGTVLATSYTYAKCKAYFKFQRPCTCIAIH